VIVFRFQKRFSAEIGENTEMSIFFGLPNDAAQLAREAFLCPVKTLARQTRHYRISGESQGA
jgi:hypothetical protein